MAGDLNLVKLCVGVESVSHLADFQNRRAAGLIAAGQEPVPRHVTRMWPRREGELLAGGSLYWVIKGLILARQEILRLDEVIGEDGIRRCGLILNPQIVLTEAFQRRPFQGWRYLEKAGAPKDTGLYRDGQEELPRELQAGLAALGVL